MRLTVRFKRLAFAQVLLGLVTYSLAEQNIGQLLIVGAVAILSWYVTEGPRGRALPRWLVNLGGLGAVAWLVFDLVVVRAHIVVALGHFIMALQVLMLWGPKANRDYAQLLMLSVLLMIGASTLTVSLLFGILTVLYCVLTLSALLLFQLKSTADAVDAINRKASPDSEHPTETRSVVGRGYRWHFRMIVLLIGAVCVVTATGIFVIMPRSAKGRFGGELAGPMARHEVGFSEEVRLGPSSETIASKDVVMNVAMSLHGQPVRAGYQGLLLRGAALDRYDPETHVWSRSRLSMRGTDRLKVGDQGATLIENASPIASYEARITLRNPESRVLFTRYPTTHLDSGTIASVLYSRIDSHLEADTSTTGATIYTIRWPLTLKLHSSPDEDDAAPADAGPTDEATTPRRWRERGRGYRRTPYAEQWQVQPKRIRGLAVSVLEQQGLLRDGEPDLTQPRQIAGALADYLREHYTYSLDNPPVGQKDPVIDFLFDRRQGHCELFAAAHVAMCRVVGLKARVVTGYRASEFNEMAGHYTVRRGNAHAWSEVLCSSEYRWLTFDATPPDAVAAEHAGASGVVGWLRDVWDVAEFAWVRTIVVYDKHSREAVIEGVEGEITEAAQDTESPIGRFIAFVLDLPENWRIDKIGYTAAGIVAVMLGIALASLARLLILRRRKLVALQLTVLPRDQRRGLARKLRFYLRMLEMLERHGYVRPSYQSPFSFAHQLAAVDAQRFNPVILLTEIFYEIRFGHRVMDEDRAERVRQHLRELERALSGRP